ncbi:MAG: trigger factor [Leptospiraceae bacterium]|nr:trigger factor [Leptospiraceae bacterium]MDW7977015.1 trigger factor [Leptospiraceae bacterium]
MEYHVQIIEPTVALVNFKTNQEDFEKAKEKTYLELSKKLKIPGFRPGRIPVEVVKRHVGDSIIAETMETLIRETYNSVLDQLDPKPISIPVFDIVKFDEKTLEMEFTAEYEFYPKIRLTKYKRLKIEKDELVEDPTLVDDALKEIAKLYKNYLPKDWEDPEKNKIEENDLVLLSIKIINKNNPKNVHEIEEYDYWMKAEDKEFPELKERLLNRKAQEEFEYEKKIEPKSKLKKFQNKQVIVKVKILEVRRESIPEIDDDFAKMVGYSSLQELKEEVRKNIRKQAEDHLEKELISRIFDEIQEKNSIHLPESLIRRRMEIELDRVLAELKLPKMSLSEFAKVAKATEKEVEELLRRRSILYLQDEIILEKIEELENIQVTQEEKKTELKKILERYEKTQELDQVVEERIKDQNWERYLDYKLRNEKVLKWLLENMDYEKGRVITTRELYEKGIIKIY